MNKGKAVQTYYTCQWPILSRSRPGMSHTVSQRRSDGRFECTCEDFFYRHAKDMSFECYHIEGVRIKEATRAVTLRLADRFETMARDLRASVR